VFGRRRRRGRIRNLLLCSVQKVPTSGSKETENGGTPRPIGNKAAKRKMEEEKTSTMLHQS